MENGTAAVPRLAGLCAEAPPAPLPLTSPALRFFWSHPDAAIRVVALGEASRCEAAAEGLRNLLTALSRPDGVSWLDGAVDGRPRPPGLWFGAIAFDPSRPVWPGFSPVRFAVPEVIVWEHGGRQFVAVLAPEGGATRAGLQSRLDHVRRALDDEAAAPSAEAETCPRAVPYQNGRAHWASLVDRALERIHAGELSKVVVARSIDVEALPRSATVLGRLERAYPSCRTFYLRGDAGAAFLGATPENFCSIDGSRLRTEALAGSARPGDADALLASAKDLREHQWVVDHIVSALRGIADEVQAAPAAVVRELATVAHLQTPISARLRSGIGVADVVAALHPTPAVGGVPAAAAARFLGEHERLDRGLYAGLVGFIGPGRAELAVALRCALVEHGIARLFLGAGIVDGSSAESEWVETQLKARALLDALEGAA
jgi:isochorismate synthase